MKWPARSASKGSPSRFGLAGLPRTEFLLWLSLRPIPGFLAAHLRHNRRLAHLLCRVLKGSEFNHMVIFLFFPR
jgi:hypothetical protein